MIFDIWKNYRDYNYQNPMIVEQSRSLNYRYISYQEFLVDRNYEEELTLLLANPYTTERNELLNAIEELTLDETKKQITGIVYRNFLRETIPYEKRLISKSKIIITIFNEDKSILSEDDLKVIQVLRESNKFLIGNRCDIGFDKVINTEQLINNKNASCVVIRKDIIDNYKHLIKNWQNIIIL